MKFLTFDLIKFLIVGTLFLLNLLPIIAPILEFFGEKNLSSFIYWLYQYFCHQKASRSIFICNNQCGWCARCMFIWFGIFVTSYISLYKIKSAEFTGISFRNAILLSIPLVLDGGIQLIATIISLLTGTYPFYQSNNTLRALTGSLFGIAMGLFLFPRLKE